jgi:hypothetical protein
MLLTHKKHRRTKAELLVLDTTGRILEAWLSGTAAQESSSSTDGTGWLTCAHSLKNDSDWSRFSQLRLRYSLGAWEEGPSVRVDYTGGMALPCGVRLGSVGQDADGHSFIAVTRDVKVGRDAQVGFAAYTPNGPE